MVARVRHLAEQGYLLYRAAACDSYRRYVRPPSVIHARVLVTPSSDFPTVFGFIGYHEPEIVQATGIALLGRNDAFVKAAAIVSLATNALATVLIAYKAWCVLRRLSLFAVLTSLIPCTRKHRQLVKKLFSAVGTKSRVLNALALLVESGSMYSALLVILRLASLSHIR